MNYNVWIINTCTCNLLIQYIEYNYDVILLLHNTHSRRPIAHKIINPEGEEWVTCHDLSTSDSCSSHPLYVQYYSNWPRYIRPHLLTDQISVDLSPNKLLAKQIFLYIAWSILCLISPIGTPQAVPQPLVKRIYTHRRDGDSSKCPIGYSDLSMPGYAKAMTEGWQTCPF